MNRAALTAWVAERHKGQLIKKTTQPYIAHLLIVADMAAPEAVWGFEVGLCHDLLEKTDAFPLQLKNALISFEYKSAEEIVKQVVELTDVFTRKAYPDLTKPQRKTQEEIRLTTISADAQTVKYADLIYNIQWVLRYQPDQAYLNQKRRLLLAMDKGSDKLRAIALQLCENRPLKDGY